MLSYMDKHGVDTKEIRCVMMARNLARVYTILNCEYHKVFFVFFKFFFSSSLRQTHALRCPWGALCRSRV